MGACDRLAEVRMGFLDNDSSLCKALRGVAGDLGNFRIDRGNARVAE